MGIVLKNQQTGQITFYLKGADVIMKEKVSIMQAEFVKEECENLAREGLRTLVISKKDISQEQFDKWFQRYEDANATLENRDKKV